MTPEETLEWLLDEHRPMPWNCNCCGGFRCSCDGSSDWDHNHLSEELQKKLSESGVQAP